ncbi:BTAD domain-containing putative transcriptional regulator [Streptomyces sp. ST2-7A]|uniref:BTAD domain-containing putative transcriptional regulator n=1 Tax=Streptomyces sp. ST2-7A TaxID=2907214 RepID=UPI002278FFA9|nr:BTAD domain-containing putative transcriptional regulator [Streptomyces sp. ST2-7A]
MDIRLLGPLEVLADDGTPLRVTGPTQRAALTALALSPDRDVPADELASDLWAMETPGPPARLRARLRSCVGRLRRALPPGRIRTVPGGYRLAAHPGETDVGRCERALAETGAPAAAHPAEVSAEAVPAPAVEDPGVALRRVEEALAQWRGEPLAELPPGPRRARESSRLHRLRSALAERRDALRRRVGAAETPPGPASGATPGARPAAAHPAAAAPLTAHPGFGMAGVPAPRAAETAPFARLTHPLAVPGGEPDPRRERAARRAVELFPLLALVEVPTHTPASAAALLGCPPGEASAALEHLRSTGILVPAGPGRYAIPGELREAAVKGGLGSAGVPGPRPTGDAGTGPRPAGTDAPPTGGTGDLGDRGVTGPSRSPGDPTAQVHRARLADLAHWYLGSLYRVNLPLALPAVVRNRYHAGVDRFPRGRLFTSPSESLPWADQELEGVLALAGQLASPAFDTGEELAGRPLSAFASEAARALETYFGIRFAWRAQRRLNGLALMVAERTGDEYSRAAALVQLGKVHGRRGEGDRGAELLTRGIDLFRALGEDLEAVAATSALVACLAISGRVELAVRVGERALGEATRPGLEALRTMVLNNLGRCRMLLGEWQEAHRLLTESYTGARLPHGRSTAAGALAGYHLRVGEYAEAARWAERALAHSAEQPFDPLMVAEHRHALAEALRGMGEIRRARIEETQAEALLADLNRRENTDVRLPVSPGACVEHGSGGESGRTEGSGRDTGETGGTGCGRGLDGT